MKVPPPLSARRCVTKRFSASAAVASSIGLVRKTNEDAACLDEKLGLYIVSDGMGATQGGGVAARLVTSVLPRMVEYFLADSPAAGPADVRHSLQRDMLALSQTIYLQSSANPMTQGMGATVVLALLADGCVHFAHLGDSRAYLYRNRRLARLTQDHSVVAMLLREGEITVPEAKVHPARGQLTRFMGMKDAVFGDIRSVRVRSGDRVLLCSDGLWGMLPETEISLILETKPDSEQACHALVASADAAGGRDNSTALVINLISNPQN